MEIWNTEWLEDLFDIWCYWHTITTRKVQNILSTKCLRKVLYFSCHLFQTQLEKYVTLMYFLFSAWNMDPFQWHFTDTVQLTTYKEAMTNIVKAWLISVMCKSNLISNLTHIIPMNHTDIIICIHEQRWLMLECLRKLTGIMRRWNDVIGNGWFTHTHTHTHKKTQKQTHTEWKRCGYR